MPVKTISLKRKFCYGEGIGSYESVDVFVSYDMSNKQERIPIVLFNLERAVNSYWVGRAGVVENIVDVIDRRSDADLEKFLEKEG